MNNKESDGRDILADQFSPDFFLNGFSLNKDERLLNTSEYARVFDNAPFKASHPNLLVLARSSDCSYPRLGLVVSKKNLRLAVQRNQLKRLIRESFRHAKHHLPAIDAIVLARRGADTLSKAETRIILNNLWTRVAKKANKHALDNRTRPST